MATNTTSPPPLTHILETCVYVRDLRASSDFYQTALNIKPFLDSPRVAGFSLASNTMLLFELGKTTKDAKIPGGVIPLHGPSQKILEQLRVPSSENEGDGEGKGRRESLRQHFCFAVSSKEDVARWEEYLGSKDIKIVSEVNWDRGGRSIYFHDLDGHVVEIASRGVWPHY
ncbi:Glyoxalase/Bleomycin resistance protein/Dihydroxybiphenyl dioxygenase [Aspergillus crustosus]